MPVGTVTGREIKQNRDGLKKVRLLRVEISDPDDLQNVELMGHAGLDHSPPNGSKVFIVQAGEAFKIAVAINDNIEPSVEPGEYEIYSSADGQKKAKISLKKDGQLIIETDSNTSISVDGDISIEASGTMTLQGGGDNAVRFSELKKAFDQLKTDHDNFLSEYKLHVHTGVTAGGASTGTTVSTQISSTADMAPAKIDDIEVP
jgi:hypothetical protein